MIPNNKCIISISPNNNPASTGMFTEKTHLGVTEVIPIEFYFVWSIDIECFLVGKDDFGPFGFPTDMVHRPRIAFHLVIGCVVDYLLQLTLGKNTSTSKLYLDRLVTYFKRNLCCDCAQGFRIFAHGTINVPKRNRRDSTWSLSWFPRPIRL